jgi:hypothetical protein
MASIASSAMHKTVDLSCPMDREAYSDWLLACNCNWLPRAD